MVARSSPVRSTTRALTTRPPSSIRCRVRLRRSTCHARISYRALAACWRLRAARLRPSAASVALSCRWSSPRPALKERGAAPGPRLPLSSIFGLSQHDQRARQFVDAKAIGPGSDDQFAKLLHLAALEVARLVLKRFQFPVEIPRLA